MRQVHGYHKKDGTFVRPHIRNVPIKLAVKYPGEKNLIAITGNAPGMVRESVMVSVESWLSKQGSAVFLKKRALDLKLHVKRIEEK